MPSAPALTGRQQCICEAGLPVQLTPPTMAACSAAEVIHCVSLQHSCFASHMLTLFSGGLYPLNI